MSFSCISFQDINRPQVSWSVVISTFSICFVSTVLKNPPGISQGHALCQGNVSYDSGIRPAGPFPAKNTVLFDLSPHTA